LFFCLEIARESGRFRIEEALEDHLRKMVRRHPHVFGEVGRLRSADAARQWEELKQSEKQSEASGPRSVLAGRLPGLPALTAAFRVQEKVSAVGFDWPALDGVLDKVEEELGELRAALAPAGAPPQPRTRSSSDGDAPAAATEAQRAELGDLLFSLVNVARFLTIDPEAALRGTTVRFSERFRYIEQRLAARGRTPTDASLAEMDALWDEAKHALHGAGGAARPRDGDPPPESRVDPTES
ncbi:MAG: YabN family protein, partial [Dehalococcoidia bacterium]